MRITLSIVKNNTIVMIDVVKNTDIIPMLLSYVINGVDIDAFVLRVNASTI
jgi:hypothetical protein